jgi:hypothetical protein
MSSLKFMLGPSELVVDFKLQQPSHSLAPESKTTSKIYQAGARPSINYEEVEEGVAELSIV